MATIRVDTLKVESRFCPRDPGSPKLRMVSWNRMEPKYYAFQRWWRTPQSSAENMTGWMPRVGTLNLHTGRRVRIVFCSMPGSPLASSFIGWFMSLGIFYYVRVFHREHKEPAFLKMVVDVQGNFITFLGYPAPRPKETKKVVDIAILQKATKQWSVVDFELIGY